VEEVTAGERKGNKGGNKETVRKEMAMIGGTGNRNLWLVVRMWQKKCYMYGSA
jgi:hypothetical protein